MEYKMVVGEDDEELEDQVNELLEKRWELYGFPFSGSFVQKVGDILESTSYLYQAMTKKRKG